MPQGPIWSAVLLPHRRPSPQTPRLPRASFFGILAPAFTQLHARARFPLVPLSPGTKPGKHAPDLTPPCDSGRGRPFSPTCTAPPTLHTWHWCSLALPRPGPLRCPGSPSPGCLSPVHQCLLGLSTPTSSCHSPVIWLLLLPAWHHRRGRPRPSGQMLVPGLESQRGGSRGKERSGQQVS